MKRQRFLAVLLSATLAFTPVINVMAEEENTPQTETEEITEQTEESGDESNEENVDIQAVDQDGTGAALDQQTEEDEENEPRNYGTIVSENANNVPVHVSDVETYAELPASYQLDKDKFPTTRDQGDYGTCWAFAALGLSEFDLISKNLADKSIDLSELQLAHFVYNSALDPLGGTQGDQSTYYNNVTSTSYLNRGGMYEYAVRRLSQWSGAVNENDVPYTQENINNVLQSGLEKQYAYSKDVAHLENAYVMSLKNNTDDVKRTIMNNGAVGVQYYHSSNCLLWNDAKQLWTYYDPAITGGAHNVMIVGWDDNFSKDNFVGDEPSSDGAWLIRNSWGFTQAYFWMSYENKSLSDAAWAFDMNTADNYDNNYQLDGGIDCYNVTSNICTYKTYSNVFNVQQKQGVASESLDAVSLSFTHVADVNYKVEIYTDLTNSNNPYSGTKHDEATVEGTTTYAGLYTIPLKQSIQLKPGSSFAVVVTTDQYALDYEQGIQWVLDPKDPKSALVWNAPVSLANGKSFYGTSQNQWAWNFGNFCIKAFTKNEKDFKEEAKGYTATLNGTIDLNFYYNIQSDSELLTDPEAYIEFTVNGKTSQVKVSDAETTAEGDKKFTCPVVAKEMASEIQAQFVLGNDRGEIYTYSVKEYAEKILNGEAGQYTDEAKALVRAMLNYGANAQTYFGFNTENLANKSLTDAEKKKSIENVDFTLYKSKTTADGTVTGIQYYGSALNLNTETNIKNYFELEPEHSIDEYTFSYTMNDKTTDVMPVQKTMDGKTLYLVEVPAIKAHLLNQYVMVTIKSKTNLNSAGTQMRYCPFSYCYAVSQVWGDNEELTNVTKSLYWYWKAADNYMNPQN